MSFIGIQNQNHSSIQTVLKRIPPYIYGYRPAWFHIIKSANKEHNSSNELIPETTLKFNNCSYNEGLWSNENDAEPPIRGSGDLFFALPFDFAF